MGFGEIKAAIGDRGSPIQQWFGPHSDIMFSRELQSLMVHVLKLSIYVRVLGSSRITNSLFFIITYPSVPLAKFG